MSHTVPRRATPKRSGESKSNEADLTGESCKRSKQNVDEYLSFAEVIFDVDIIYNESKEKKKETLEILIKHIVALLNSVGGVIRINESGNDETRIISDRDKWMQSLQLRLLTIMGQEQYKECIYSFPKSYPYYYMFVRKSKRVCTQNTGLKISLSRSVVDANYEGIVNILNPKSVIEPSSESSSLEMGEEVNMESGQDSGYQGDSLTNFTDHEHTEFQFDGKVSFEESDSIQFKLINDGAATTLSQLLKGIDKHLPKYVSAFANHRGGDVYFGIDDDGTVKGELVKGEDEKTEVKRMVEKIMNRKNENQESVRIWGKSDFIAKYGEQWSVEFIKVIGEPEDEERYVVVVHIYSFIGGMFLERPLAWTVDETEKIVEMDFDEWKNRHISDPDDYQEKLKRFECLTLDGMAKRVFQLKDMTKKFAKKVFPEAEKGLTFVTERFVERFKIERHKACVQHLQKILQQSYLNTRGFAMFDKSWSGNVGAGLAPEEVICDVFIMSHAGMPQLITLASERSQEVIDYNVNLAKKLKRVLVSKGGCLECFLIDFRVIVINDVNDEMRFFPPNGCPRRYTMTQLLSIFKKIREALVIVVAGFESSSFNPKVGVSFLYVLTPEQYKISIKEDPFVMVTGPPGTGKTVVAMERIKKLRARNVPKDEILYVCENKALFFFIWSEVGNDCLTTTRAKLMSKIKQGQHREFNKVRHVVVDEVQHFRNETGEDWLESISTSILKWTPDSQQHCDNTSLYIFGDGLQKIRRECLGIPDRPRMMLPVPTKCQLSTVIRNSIKIYKKWEEIALEQPDFEQKNHLAIGHDYQGRDINFVEISSDCENEIFSKVEGTIRQILDEKSYKAIEVAVLFNEKGLAEKFRKHLIPHFAELNIPVTDAEVFPRKGLVVDSFRRFNGLDAPVVVAVLPKTYSKYEDINKVKILLYSRAMVEFHIILLAEAPEAT